MSIVCEVCGDVGYVPLLACCRFCKEVFTHRYCLAKIVYDATFVEFVSYECQQKNSDVDKVPSAGAPSHAYSGLMVYEPNTKRLEPEGDLPQWGSRKRRSGNYYSRRRGSKKKSSMKPMGNLKHRKTEAYQSNDGENRQTDNEHSAHALDNVKQPSPMIVCCLGYKLGTADISKVRSRSACKSMTKGSNRQHGGRP